MRKQKGITLVALVVTIIVLIILASVSINLVLGENGIIARAKQAKEAMEQAQKEEQEKLENLYVKLEYEISNGWNTEKKVNEPQLLDGMTPIKFEYPTEDVMGQTIKTSVSDSNWYEYGTTYETKRWANAMTENGSIWVCIPRFAYKINSNTKLTEKCRNLTIKISTFLCLI